MKRLLWLSVLCFWAMGCETEGIKIGFKDAPQLARLEWTGVTVAWPVVVVAGLIMWVIYGLRSKKRKDQ